MRAGRSNTFKVLCSAPICLGVWRASPPKCSSTRAVLRALHLHLPKDGKALFARRRRGARRGRALAKARRSPVRSTTSSAPLSASRAHRVRHRRRNTDGGTPAAVASLAGNAATQTPGRAQRSRAGGRAWTALELRSGRARAASGLRLELLEEELRDGREATRWRRERAARGLLRSCASRCA